MLAEGKAEHKGARGGAGACGRCRVRVRGQCWESVPGSGWGSVPGSVSAPLSVPGVDVGAGVRSGVGARFGFGPGLVSVSG